MTSLQFFLHKSDCVLLAGKRLTDSILSIRFVLVELGSPAGKCSKSNLIKMNLESNNSKQLKNKRKFRK